jgi:hypothetical protein
MSSDQKPLKGLPILPLNAIRPGLCPPAAPAVGASRRGFHIPTETFEIR